MGVGRYRGNGGIYYMHGNSSGSEHDGIMTMGIEICKVFSVDCIMGLMQQRYLLAKHREFRPPPLYYRRSPLSVSRSEIGISISKRSFIDRGIMRLPGGETVSTLGLRFDAITNRDG